MTKIKEVLVFSEQGDPREKKTWSNVPAFLVETLASKNIKVHTVDLSRVGLIHRAIGKIYDIIFKNFYPDVKYPFNLSSIHNFLVNQKIRQAVKAHSNTQLYIFTTFSFSASKVSDKPSVLFCDWTIEHYLEYFLERPHNSLEQYAIVSQNRTIEAAAAVFVLFPAIAEMMRNKYLNKHIYYNGNVVNNQVQPSPKSIDLKMNSMNLLFVGSKKYIEGAQKLIAAFLILKTEYRALTLHIVGITRSELGDIPKDVYAYGYLDKSNSRDASTYYELLNTAKVFINTTPKWASFSSCLEAMYFSTPIVVTAYKEFIYTFGDPIDFGFYYRSEADTLVELIEKVLNSQTYDQMCTAAHAAARVHSWDQYVDRMLAQVNPLV